MSEATRALDESDLTLTRSEKTASLDRLSIDHNASVRPRYAFCTARQMSAQSKSPQAPSPSLGGQLSPVGGMTTAQLAAQLNLKPQTLLKRHSQTGSYLGIRPKKFLNGRLCWPIDSINTLLGGGKHCTPSPSAPEHEIKS